MMKETISLLLNLKLLMLVMHLVIIILVYSNNQIDLQKKKLLEKQKLLELWEKFLMKMKNI